MPAALSMAGAGADSGLGPLAGLAAEGGQRLRLGVAEIGAVEADVAVREIDLHDADEGLCLEQARLRREAEALEPVAGHVDGDHLRQSHLPTAIEIGRR